MSCHAMVVTLGNHCVVFFILTQEIVVLLKGVVFSNGNYVELPPRNDCVKEWPFHGGNVLLGNCLEKWLFCVTKWQVVDWLWNARSHIPSLGMLDFISKFAIFTNNYQIIEIFNFLVQFHNEPKIMDDDCMWMNIFMMDEKLKKKHAQ
jgi:hypothetical protein